MSDVETALRQGFEALAAETASVVTPPSVGSIKFRARTDQAQSRRWPKVVTAIAAGMVVTTGMAAAVGVLPGPVESMLSEFRSWGFGANQGAQRMAWVTDGDMTYEVWQAPLDDGGDCVYDRVIGPDGDVDHGGASQCVSVRQSPGRQIGSAICTIRSRSTTIRMAAGQAPERTRCPPDSCRWARRKSCSSSTTERPLRSQLSGRATSSRRSLTSGTALESSRSPPLTPKVTSSRAGKGFGGRLSCFGRWPRPPGPAGPVEIL